MCLWKRYYDDILMIMNALKASTRACQLLLNWEAKAWFGDSVCTYGNLARYAAITNRHMHPTMWWLLYIMYNRNVRVHKRVFWYPSFLNLDLNVNPPQVIAARNMVTFNTNQNNPIHDARVRRGMLSRTTVHIILTTIRET